MTECKEIACTTCMHRGVCVYKDNFRSACNAVGDVTVHLGSGRTINLRDIQWIEQIDLRCKHYYKEKEVILR